MKPLINSFLSSTNLLMASDSNKAKSSGCGGTGASAGLRPPDQGLKCPRCDSPNTKFCYYNNYSLTQPRHFCKSCRRYWTKGGALRNVPVGGGCRKNRKSKSSSSVSSLVPSSGDQTIATQDLFLPFPFAPNAGYSNYSNVASSIESLSSINQDLHWRLQQQRMQMLLGGELGQKSLMNSNQAAEPNCFAINAESNKGEIFDGARKQSSETGTTAWFLDGSFSMPTPPAINNTDHVQINNANNSVSDWNAMSVWSDVHNFTALP